MNNLIKILAEITDSTVGESCLSSQTQKIPGEFEKDMYF